MALGLVNRVIAPDSVVIGASGSLPGCMQRMWRPSVANTYNMEYGYSCMGYEVSGALGVKLAIGDKREVYAIIKEEAARGRTFIWYSTELEELNHCDHIYVFRNGQAVADMPRNELSEAQILRSSFQEEVA